jgi:hypothetical protein
MEKARIWQGIILQDYAFLDMGKKPVDRGRNGVATTQVLIAVESMHLARPIDESLHARPSLLAQFHITRTSSSWTIRSQKQPLWPRRSDLGKDPSRSFRAIEKEEKNGNF